MPMNKMIFSQTANFLWYLFVPLCIFTVEIELASFSHAAVLFIRVDYCTHGQRAKERYDVQDRPAGTVN